MDLVTHIEDMYSAHNTICRLQLHVLSQPSTIYIARVGPIKLKSNRPFQPRQLQFANPQQTSSTSSSSTFAKQAAVTDMCKQGGCIMPVVPKSAVTVLPRGCEWYETLLTSGLFALLIIERPNTENEQQSVSLLRRRWVCMTVGTCQKSFLR